jgi:hypothetical protein
MTFRDVFAITIIITVAQACGNVLHAAIRNWLTTRSVRKMQEAMLKDAEEWAHSRMAHQPRSVGRGAN